MAGKTSGERYIGKLMLDISEVQNQIKEVNDWLGKIGANINLEDKLSNKVSTALQKLVDEAKKAGEEAQKAITNPAKPSGENEELKKAIKLWKEYYELMAKAQQAKNTGKENQAAFYEKEANAIIANVKALRDEAEAVESVAKAKRSYNAAVEAGKDKEVAKAAAAAAKEQAIAQKELEKAQKEAAKAAKEESTAVENQAVGLSSHMKNATSEVKTFGAEVNNQGQAVESLVSTVTTGFDQAGNKIKETANSQGQIVKRTEETKAAISSLISLYEQQHQKQAQIFELEQRDETGTSKYAKLKEELAAINERIGQYSQSAQNAARQTKEFDDILTKYGHTIKGIRTGAQLDEENKRTSEAIRLWKEYYQLLTKAQQAKNNNNQNQASFYEKEAQAVREKASALKNEAEVTDELVKVKRDYNAAQAAGQDKKEEQTANNIANVRQRIVGILRQQKQVRQDIIHDGEKEAENYDEIGSQISGMLTRFISIYTVIRSISSLVNNTVDYVSQYYDKMNEIQIITQKSNEEIAQLGETYRDIAKEMNASSLEIADAAVYFTRQGLAAEEIEKRLKNVTMYAKTANVDFKDASEIITAVVNSMGLVEQEAEDGRNATQRVADVFLKVGDSAATSGQEIGEAMQKAAASAGAFGMSLEWLTAYIATVSETTRQEARTIGTAFNTIIARLHQIKQQGYNSDDETKINDIQKALANVGIALMDNNNEWRDMDTIFQEIGSKWDTFDGKTKSYIATTMAGVKQQNVFLALMNDLAKSTEGESRAMQLYTTAINSNGTAQEKYATWTDSVAASQERLNIAQEKFYSLMDASVIKNWNNFLAGFVNMITEGTEKTKGFNIVLTALITIGAGVIATIVLAKAELISLNAILVTLSHHPIVIILTAVAAAATLAISAFSALGSVLSNSTERFNEASKAISESRSKIDKYLGTQKQITEMFEKLESAGENTGAILDQYGDLLDGITEVSPRAKAAVLELKEGLIDQKEAAEILNEELEKVIANEKRVGTVELIKYLRNYEGQTGTNLDFVKRYQTWDEDWFGGNYNAEGFANALKTVSSNSNYYRKYISVEEKKFINELLDEGITNWDTIATLFWDKFVNGKTYNPGELFREKVMDMVQKTMETIGQDLDHIDRTAYQNKLMEFLIGDDGELKVKTLQEAKNAILSFVGLFANDMVDILPSDRSGVLLDEIFGSMLGDDPKQAILDRLNELGLDEDFAYGLTQILEAGIDKDLIANFLNRLPVEKWGNLYEEMQAKLLSIISSKAGAPIHDVDDEGNIDMLMWDQLDLSTLKLIYDLMDAGTALSDIKEAMRDSSSVDEFAEKLNNIRQGLGADKNKKSFSDLIKEIKSYISDIDDLDSVIENLRKGEEIKSSDLLDLASAHPEIMGFINDTDELLRQLERIKSSIKESAFEDVKNSILDNPDYMKNSSYSQYITDDIQTLRDYLKTLGEASADYAYIMYDIELATVKFFEATGELNKIDTGKLKEIQEILYGQSNVDLNKRPVIDASKLTEAGWKDAGEGIATVFTSSYTAGEKGIKWNENVIVSVTPILENGEVMSPDALDAYMDELFAKSGSTEELLMNDTAGLVIDVEAKMDDESWDEAEARAEAFMDLLHKIQELIYGEPGKEESWLEQQVRTMKEAEELNWAKSNGYTQQLNNLGYTIQNEGILEAVELWDSYDETLQRAIVETYPDLAKVILDAKEAIDEETGSTEKQTKATDNMWKAVSKYQKYATAKYFTNTYEAIQKLEKGTISATDAYDTFYSEMDKVTKAGEEIVNVQNKIANGEWSEVTGNNVNDLADLLGVSTDAILNDFDGAVEAFNNLTAAGGDLEQALNALNAAAFIRITGVSEADFSNIQDGLIAVQNVAQDTIDMLVKTGQWTVETIPLDGKQWVLNGDKLELQEFSGAYQKVLKPTGSNPYSSSYKGSSSSSNKNNNSNSSSGSSGSSSSSSMTEVEKMLDMMGQVKDIQDDQQSYYQAQQSYYKQTGQLQGVIGYMEKEKAALEDQNSTLEANIATIESYIKAKTEELNSLSTSDDDYEEVADDLDKLQDTHAEYTEKLVENKTAIDELTESIQDQKDAIRQMEIDLRELIYSAIEDREEKVKNMLDNEIDMENTVFELIKKRYEEERDQIIDTTNMKIDALEEERDLLSEQLALRKAQADQEDKAKKLRDLEIQYERIAADPTRAKEAKNIQKDIADLREEMAWDAAEAEVEAQQSSIDQQIDSLNDYITEVENYYEDLFEHPQKLIAEMREIMELTDEEIIDWLKEHDEEYAASSENRKKQIVDDWQETLDEMNGKVKTYWDEVEDIIAKGDDYIIDFLKENSADYAEAGELQAEAYVDAWKEQLEDLKKAYEEVTTVAANSYVVIEPSTSSSGGSSGSSGGSGGSGGDDSKHGYSFTYNGKAYSKEGFQSKGFANSAGLEAISNLAKNERDSNDKTNSRDWSVHEFNNTEIGKRERTAKSSLVSYLGGGVADFTGPAWLDGTKQNPERILSPYQTQLFESMVNALEQMSKIQIPSMPNFGDIELSGNGGVSVGDIIVNVDNLDTDDDYEELAEKVSDVLMERIGKTTVVGGLRINSF